MQRFTDTVQTRAGVAIQGATATVYLTGTTTLATLYSDDGVTLETNPVTTDVNGEFTFYAANGTYDILIEGSGLATRTREGIQLYDMSEAGAPWFDVTDAAFGAVGDGVTDDSAAIQAAIDAADALSQKGTVFFPAGQYLVSQTLTFGRTPLIGTGFWSEIVTTISDGSAVLQNDAVGDRVHIENLSIVNNDPNTTGNFTGVYIDSNRGYMSNVRVRRAAVGFYIEGWIHDFVNLWAYYCGVGLQGTLLNSVRINVNTEVCTTGVEITNSGGLWISGVAEDHDTGIVMDGVAASTVDMYFEGESAAEILMGQTTLCKSITLNCTIASTVGSIFDNVDGLDMTGTRVSSGAGVYFTENCLNVQNPPISTPGTYSATMSYPQNIKAVSGFAAPQNYFLNPYFRDAFRGYSAVTIARGTVAIDTTSALRGGGLELTPLGADNGAVTVQIELGSAIAADLAGKKVMFGGWVYIPDNDTDYPDTGSQFIPYIGLGYYTGGAWYSLVSGHPDMEKRWVVFLLPACDR